jgi:hypothetical protein
MVNAVEETQMPRFTRYTLAATAALIVGSLQLPAHAAPAPATQAAADVITFDQYRDWRLNFIEQRQTQIAAELAENGLTPERRTGLERQKAYYDFFANMTPAERDRRFRDRFDQIDANHDGVIDPAERAAWHDKQRAFYDRPSAYRHTAATDDLSRR